MSFMYFTKSLPCSTKLHVVTGSVFLQSFSNSTGLAVVYIQAYSEYINLRLIKLHFFVKCLNWPIQPQWSFVSKINWKMCIKALHLSYVNRLKKHCIHEQHWDYHGCHMLQTDQANKHANIYIIQYIRFQVFLLNLENGSNMESALHSLNLVNHRSVTMSKLYIYVHVHQSLNVFYAWS